MYFESTLLISDPRDLVYTLETATIIIASLVSSTILKLKILESRGPDFDETYCWLFPDQDWNFFWDKDWDRDFDDSQNLEYMRLRLFHIYDTFIFIRRVEILPSSDILGFVQTLGWLAWLRRGVCLFTRVR